MLRSLLSGPITWSSVISLIIAFLVSMIISLPIHEFAHGFAASKLGDPTAKYQGRLTLNPFAHLDYFGAFAMLLFGFGWAKPVPVNPRYFKNQKVGMAITAFAGPLSNLLLCFVALLLRWFTIALYVSNVTLNTPVFVRSLVELLKSIFEIVAVINISLAIFNLIPIPPLDGSRIATMFMSNRTYFKIMEYERYFGIAIIAVVYLFSNQISAVSYSVLNLIDSLAYLPFSAFLKF